MKPAGKERAKKRSARPPGGAALTEIAVLEMAIGLIRHVAKGSIEVTIDDAIPLLHRLGGDVLVRVYNGDAQVHAEIELSGDARVSACLVVELTPAERKLSTADLARLAKKRAGLTEEEADAETVQAAALRELGLHESLSASELHRLLKGRRLRYGTVVCHLVELQKRGLLLEREDGRYVVVAAEGCSP